MEFNKRLLVRLALFCCLFLRFGLSNCQTISELEKSIEDFEKAQQFEKAAPVAAQLANQYFNKDQYEKAVEYALKAAEWFEKSNNVTGQSGAFQIVALSYTYSDQPSKALPYYEKVVQSRRKFGKPKELCNALVNLGVTQVETKAYGQAIQTFKEALPIAEKENIKTAISDTHNYLAIAYEKVGDKENALKYAKLYNQSYNDEREAFLQQMEKDKLNADNLAKQKERIALEKDKSLVDNLNALRAKDDTIQKQFDELMNVMEQKEVIEKLNAYNQLELDQKNAQLRADRYLFVVLGLVLVFILSVVFLLVKTNKQKTRNNLALRQKNEQISAQNQEITRQKDALEASEKVIKEKNTHIMDSIRAAEMIQRAILPSKALFSASFQDFFIFFKPKDLVSGDFYWSVKTPDALYFAVADCTGHGVPGAFISMIGNVLLNQAVSQMALSSCAQILDYLDRQIRVSLQQEAGEPFDFSASRHGMDIVLCKLHNDFSLEFAGAKRPLFVFQNKQLVELKPTRKSIGSRPLPNAQTFTNQTIELAKGDWLYLTTDGFVDQDNTKGERFGTDALLELLKNNAQQDANTQFKALDDAFQGHKSTRSQRDDIAILGLQI